MREVVQRILRRAVALAALWAAAGAPAPTAAQTSPGPDPQRPSRRYYTQAQPAEQVVRPQAIALAYRDALSLLAAGDSAAAAEAVAELDPPRGSTAESVHATEQGLATVLHGIALHDHRALEPVILLHVGAFRRHREARDSRLVEHHLALLRFAVTEYAQSGGTPEASATAAEVLAAVGLALLEDQRRTAANIHFERALKLDSTNAHALLGLAVDRERAGDYPAAVDRLERLVKLRPESAEARLRLAINLQRVGRQRNANELFRGLTADPEADWAAAVAYQELARNRIADGEPADAAALLREASARFPGSERLRLQLAYALDRTGDPAAARKAVAELATSPPDGDQDSARRRYNRCPDPTPVLALEALQQSAGERLGALAAALESVSISESA